MTSSVVVVTEIALVALLLLMAFRMLALVRSTPATETSALNQLAAAQPRNLSQPLPPSPLNASDRADLTSKLHILAGLQNRDCKQGGLSIEQAPPLVQGFSAAWLYGAAIALCEPRRRHSEDLLDLVAHIGRLKLGIEERETYEAIETLTESSAALACYREGLEGAKFWRQHNYVPPEHSLRGALTVNAFI